MPRRTDIIDSSVARRNARVSSIRQVEGIGRMRVRNRRPAAAEVPRRARPRWSRQATHCTVLTRQAGLALLLRAKVLHVAESASRARELIRKTSHGRAIRSDWAVERIRGVDRAEKACGTHLAGVITSLILVRSRFAGDGVVRPNRTTVTRGTHELIKLSRIRRSTWAEITGQALKFAQHCSVVGAVVPLHARITV